MSGQIADNPSPTNGNGQQQRNRTPRKARSRSPRKARSPGQKAARKLASPAAVRPPAQPLPAAPARATIATAVRDARTIGGMPPVSLINLVEALPPTGHAFPQPQREAWKQTIAAAIDFFYPLKAGAAA